MIYSERFIFRKEWPDRKISPPANLDVRCHASTLIELRDGSILASWFEGTYETAPDVAVYGSRWSSVDNGWSRPFLLANSDGKSDGNSVFFLYPDGRLRIYFMTLYGDMWDESIISYKESIDGGTTWGQPAIFKKDFGWMVRNKPICLSNGRILFPIYDEQQFSSFMLISDDKGETWSESGMITSKPGNLQPAVVELSNGSLLALCRYYGKPGNIWQSISTDGGMTWTPASLTDLPNPNSSVDLIRTSSGNLVLIYNDSQFARAPLAVALSEDDGKTWPTKRYIEDVPGTFSYPAIIQASNDLLHLTYSYNYLSIKHVIMDEEWIRDRT